MDGNGCIDGTCLFRVETAFQASVNGVFFVELFGGASAHPPRLVEFDTVFATTQNDIEVSGLRPVTLNLKLAPE